MCINTSIIVKAFKYQGKKISIIKCNDEIWFRGKSIAQLLGYSKPLKLYTLTLIKRISKNCPTFKVYPKTGYTL